jgi:hypothetical protein
VHEGELVEELCGAPDEAVVAHTTGRHQRQAAGAGAARRAVRGDPGDSRGGAQRADDQSPQTDRAQGRGDGAAQRRMGGASLLCVEVPAPRR